MRECVRNVGMHLWTRLTSLCLQLQLSVWSREERAGYGKAVVLLVSGGLFRVSELPRKTRLVVLQTLFLTRTDAGLQY